MTNAWLDREQDPPLDRELAVIADLLGRTLETGGEATEAFVGG